jgi:hypothetical protein
VPGQLSGSLASRLRDWVHCLAAVRDPAVGEGAAWTPDVEHEDREHEDRVFIAVLLFANSTGRIP